MTGTQTYTEPTQATPSFPFGKIVYVGDLAGEASYGLRYAQQLAHEQQAELVLVHSLDPVVYALPGAGVGDAEGDAELASMDSDPRRHGANHDSLVQREQVCEEILAEARRHSATLVILGTLARTAAGRVALATVAPLLLADTPCSILTVTTPAESTPLPRYLWERVIAATDFSPASITALDLAQRITRRTLTVLHCTQCGKEQECTHCMARLRLLAPFNEAHTLPVEHLVSSANLVTAIASQRQKMHSDLLILGAPALGIDSGHLNESTIYQAIVESPCPVLLVPAGGDPSARTIDKATYAWLEKVQCANGEPPL